MNEFNPLIENITGVEQRKELANYDEINKFILKKYKYAKPLSNRLDYDNDENFAYTCNFHSLFNTIASNKGTYKPTYFARCNGKEYQISTKAFKQLTKSGIILDSNL